MFLNDCGEIEGQLEGTYTHVGLLFVRDRICKLSRAFAQSRFKDAGDVRQIDEGESLIKCRLKREQMPLHLRIYVHWYNARLGTGRGCAPLVKLVSNPRTNCLVGTPH